MFLHLGVHREHPGLLLPAPGEEHLLDGQPVHVVLDRWRWRKWRRGRRRRSQRNVRVVEIEFQSIFARSDDSCLLDDGGLLYNDNDYH